MLDQIFWNSQNICKCFWSVSKTRNVVHYNKPIQYNSFFQKIFITRWFFFSAKNLTNHQNSLFLGYLNSASWSTKQSLILFALSVESDIFDIVWYSLISLNILFLPKFWIKVVFLQPVLPTTKIFPSNLEQYK